jgi:hypothetical protein
MLRNPQRIESDLLGTLRQRRQMAGLRSGSHDESYLHGTSIGIVCGLLASGAVAPGVESHVPCIQQKLMPANGGKQPGTADPDYALTRPPRHHDNGVLPCRPARCRQVAAPDWRTMPRGDVPGMA